MRFLITIPAPENHEWVRSTVFLSNFEYNRAIWVTEFDEVDGHTVNLRSPLRTFLFVRVVPWGPWGPGALGRGPGARPGPSDRGPIRPRHSKTPKIQSRFQILSVGVLKHTLWSRT